MTELGWNRTRQALLRSRTTVAGAFAYSFPTFEASESCLARREGGLSVNQRCQLILEEFG